MKLSTSPQHSSGGLGCLLRSIARGRAATSLTPYLPKQPPVRCLPMTHRDLQASESIRVGYTSVRHLQPNTKQPSFT